MIAKTVGAWASDGLVSPSVGYSLGWGRSTFHVIGGGANVTAAVVEDGGFHQSCSLRSRRLRSLLPDTACILLVHVG